MNILPYLITILIIAYLLIYLITIWSNTRRANLEEYDLQEQQIIKEIEQYTLKLSEQRQQYESSKVNKRDNLKESVSTVLDIYEQSNIRIPIEIIDETTFMNFTNEKEVFDYIENQRYYWKLENTKKPFKKVT